MFSFHPQLSHSSAYAARYGAGPALLGDDILPDPRYRYEYLRSNAEWGEIPAQDDAMALPVLYGSAELPALALLPSRRLASGEMVELRQPVDPAAGCGPLPNLFALSGGTGMFYGAGDSVAPLATRLGLDESTGLASSGGSTEDGEEEAGVSVAGKPARLRGNAALLAFHLAARPKYLGRKRPRRIPSDFKDPWAYTARVVKAAGKEKAGDTGAPAVPAAKPTAANGDQKMSDAFADPGTGKSAKGEPASRDRSFGLSKRELVGASMRGLWRLAKADEREARTKARKEAKEKAKAEGKAQDDTEDSAYDGDDDGGANDEIFEVVVLNPSSDAVEAAAAGPAGAGATITGKQQGDAKVTATGGDGGAAAAAAATAAPVAPAMTAAAAAPAPASAAAAPAAGATASATANMVVGTQAANGTFVPAPPASGRDDYEIATTNSDEELEVGVMGLRAIPSDAVPAGARGSTALKRPYDAFVMASVAGAGAKNDKAFDAQRRQWRRQVRDFNRRQLRDDQGELVLQGFDRSDGDIPVAVYLSSTRAGIRKVWGHCDGIGNGLAYRRRYYYGLNPDGADYDVADDYSDPEDAFGLDQAVVSATEPALQEEQARVLQARMQQQVSAALAGSGDASYRAGRSAATGVRACCCPVHWLCDAMRYDAMRSAAIRCDPMRSDAIRCSAM